jgi:hypothetical protein
VNSINPAQLKELAIRYIDAGMEQGSIWKLCEKGFLYDLFKVGNAVSGDYLIGFYGVINQVLKKKLISKKNSNVNILPNGRWLVFDPTSTMYDGVAEAESSGFFDSGDVPPPEFWLGVYDEVLVSFIPEKFLNIAILGVNSCISGSLSWYE